MENTLPKYQWVKRDIESKIASLTYKPNQVLPSESELCHMYQVSRITIRRAIDELVFEEKLFKIKGKGCFVRDDSFKSVSRIRSLTETIASQGKIPGRKQLSFVKAKAEQIVGNALKIKPGDDIYLLKCLYLVDNQPYCVNLSILPVQMFPRLDSFNFNVCSLYEILYSFYQVNFSRSNQKLTATLPDSELESILGLDSQQPLLRIHSTSYCLQGNQEMPFELSQTFIRTDVLDYTIEQNRLQSQL